MITQNNMKNTPDKDIEIVNKSMESIIDISTQINKMIEEIGINNKEMLLTKTLIQNNLFQLIKHATICNSEIKKVLDLKRKLQTLDQELKNSVKNINDKLFKSIASVIDEKMYVDENGKVVKNYIN